ncbi:hypothetical protein [Flagellimonas beolgyonensis]|uniref:hypothetical protein n=1 Tax=Flagellimonas beolgyonensis TaxID=864064 RepID=UPI0019D1E66C|nr:hypothetical protein [Allomuricauda beolgyonensis]
MDNHNLINVLFEKSNRIPQDGFVVLLFTGLFQYGLLTLGISIILILSYFLFKEKKGPKKYKNKHGNEIIERGHESYVMPEEYLKTGASYKIFLRNNTDKIVTIKDKFTLGPNEDKVFLFVDTDSISFDIGAEIYFGEYGLEISDKKSQIAGIGGEYWEKYNVPNNVEYGFVIVPKGEGDIATK